jgi:hypothetical protein
LLLLSDLFGDLFRSFLRFLRTLTLLHGCYNSEYQARNIEISCGNLILVSQCYWACWGGRCGSANSVQLLLAPVQIARTLPSQTECSDDTRYDSTKPTASLWEPFGTRRKCLCSTVTLQPNSNTRVAKWKLCIHLLPSTFVLSIRPRSFRYLRHYSNLKPFLQYNIFEPSILVNLYAQSFYTAPRRGRRYHSVLGRLQQ